MKNKLKSPSVLILYVVGLIFFGIGIWYEIPSREIPYFYEEYGGGDAYNLIIEASIRGGEIAGATVAKAVYIVFGVFLMLCGFFWDMYSIRKISDKGSNAESVTENNAKEPKVENKENTPEPEKNETSANISKAQELSAKIDNTYSLYGVEEVLKEIKVCEDLNKSDYDFLIEKCHQKRVDISNKMI